MLIHNVCYHFPVEELHDALGIPRVVLAVGHHDDGGAFAVKFGEKFHDFHTVFRIEVSGRLVGQYELGAGDDGAGNGYSLLLSSR